MITRVPSTNGGVGKSFKGTAAYLLHDENHATTDERVMWTQTHNLATDDPEFASRLMAATAKSARHLQERHHEAEQAKLPEDERTKFRAAKPGFNHVWHFSLSWSGEKEGHTLTREEMTRAALDSLRHLKADHLQALIVAHDAETNPHVHVMVNRINPETGRTETPESNAKRKLAEWALQYEKDRGYVLCPARERNAMLRDVGSRYQAEDLSPQDHRARQVAAAAIAADPKAAKMFAAEQKTLDKALSDASKAMAARHKQQLDTMFADHNRRKAGINRFADQNVEHSSNHIRDEWAPRFMHQRTAQQEEKDQFIDREATLYGKAVNFRETIKAMRETGWEQERGLLGKVSDALFNSAARLQALERLHDKQQREKSAEMRAEIDQAKAQIEDERQAAIHSNYERFTTKQQQVAEIHEIEKAADRDAWQKRGQEREQSWSEFAASHGLQQDFENNRPRNEALEAQRGIAADQFGKAANDDDDHQDEREDSDESMSENAQAKADAFKEQLAGSTGQGSTPDRIQEAKRRYRERVAKEQDNTRKRDRGQENDE